MTALATSSSLLAITNPSAHFLSSGSPLKSKKQFLVSISPSTLSGEATRATCRRPLRVRASGDGGRTSSAGIFVGGFVLGGIVVGTLGCVYAPQISKALAGTDRKDLMRKLPKFIYDEEKALEKTRKILTDKIAQLNSAIDEVSAQLHADDAPNTASVNPDVIEDSSI
ncbi:hypothetical protein HS088_TW13G00979 [Tripterygium wilfordii]|uniref:Localized to the inner membrane of the chloroplast n=1 Tax=Tripterygium wilfordii TaxID=458696 RepID=A0A7J7CVM0_TRIWF|nr:uncharacterized protein LOC120013012 [Tripterygium wilfordii]KAF5738084.1 hypothetical protein HS088_TW13G00979 [Tripterygium wilfordii]